MASSIDNLPILGNVSLPVHIMHYNDKESGSKKFFQSGFAFFAVADDQADVEDNEGNNIGTLGSCMGGHYQVRAKREKDSISVIINVKDIWDKVNELFDSEDVQIKFEGMEEIYNEYWPKYQAAQEEKKEKKAKIKEIEDMQKAAEAERMVEIERAERAKKYEDMGIDIEAERQAEAEKVERENVIPGKQYGEIEIIDDNGWNLEDTIPEHDYEAEEVEMKISPDFGLGVKTRYKGENYTYKRNPRKKPTVTLEITTWRGTSIGAIHYYGKLIVDLPDMEKDDRPGYTVGISGHGGIPMFSNDDIELTQVLEQWEIDKYPTHYEYCRAGQRNRGFYAVAGVERRAKEVFEKIFGEGWKLKIDKRF